MKIGTAVISIIGIPSLLSALWFGYLAFTQKCIYMFIGPVICGWHLYTFTLFGLVTLTLTILLARLWDD